MKGRQRLGTHRIYRYNSLDIALAFKKVAEDRYGNDCICPTKYWIIFDNPVNYLTVDIDSDKTEQVILGEVRIKSKKLTADFLVCGESGNSDFISCFTPEKFRTEAESFLEAIETHLRTKSIYKGKAIGLDGKFIDTSKVDPADFFYNEKDFGEISTHIWTMIENTARCRAEKIPLRRKILLTGIFGAGKTFTAYLTAKKAVENGWTFLYLPPTAEGNKKAITELYTIARRYSPAVIFIEDIDHEQRAGNAYELQKTLAEFDGINSKKDEIVTVMTANKSDKIAGGMQRPGRIDKIIPLGSTSRKDIEKFIRSNIRQEILETNIDWEKLADHCKGYPPAFLSGIATSSVLHVINNKAEKVGTELLVKAADELRKQLEACENAMGFR